MNTSYLAKTPGEVTLITTADGKSYAGATIREAVEAMHASAMFCADQTFDEYIKGVAERTVKWQGGPEPRTDTFSNFVSDMERNGMFKIFLRNQECPCK